MRVKFIKRYISRNTKYYPGEVVEVERKKAEWLIKKGFAELFKGGDKKIIRLIYPSEIASGNVWFINNQGEAYIRKLKNISNDIQQVKAIKNFSYIATNDKIIDFKKGDYFFCESKKLLDKKIKAE